MPREPQWWYQSSGLTPAALSPIAAIYGAVAARRLTSDRAYRSRLPVICVGNFTAGGSGKTPLTAMLLPLLVARGERPAVLTRGYGGRTHGPHWVDVATDTAAYVGDEPLLLARLAPTLVARDRRAGAHQIEDQGRATCIVMDDGLQNAALIKDLTIAVVDGARGIGNGYVIPAGPLRAPMAAQGALVDAIVFNGIPHDGLASRLADESAAPQITARLEPTGDVSWLAGQKVVAFAGIGHPARFFALLERLGAHVVEQVAYPDHAAFTDADADQLTVLAAQHGAQLITTAKDHVRLAGSEKRAALAHAAKPLPVAMQLDDAAPLMRLLDQTFGKP